MKALELLFEITDVTKGLQDAGNFARNRAIKPKRSIKTMSKMAEKRLSKYDPKKRQSGLVVKQALDNSSNVTMVAAPAMILSAATALMSR